MGTRMDPQLAPGLSDMNTLRKSPLGLSHMKKVKFDVEEAWDKQTGFVSLLFSTFGF